MKYQANYIKAFWVPADITDEIIFKDLMKKIITDLDIDELRKIFSFGKKERIRHESVNMIANVSRHKPSTEIEYMVSIDIPYREIN